MSKVEMLRAFVNQRLTAAAEEIFELFERTIAEYEEQLEFSSRENQRQQKLLEAVLNPEVRLHGAGIQQPLVVKEEIPTEQQEWSLSLDQDPEPPHITDIQEDFWTSLSGPVKSEDDDEEVAQSSKLHERQTEENREAEYLKTEADEEDYGGPEPARNSDPGGLLQPATYNKTSPSSELQTDHSRDLEEIEGHQSGSNILQNSDVECNTGIHLQKHTGIQSEGKPYSCSICGKTFATSSSLTSHFRVHSAGKHLSCSVCRTGVSCNIHLVRHVKIHTGEKPFSCSDCGKRFTQKHNLKQHLTVHTGEKPFSCPDCGKRFSQKEHLKRHLIVHTGEKQFACSVCDKRFTLLHNVKRHKCVGESSGKK